MRLLRSLGSATARFVRRPAVWGTALLLTVVIVGSLSVGKYVVVPAIFASDAFSRSGVGAKASGKVQKAALLGAASRPKTIGAGFQETSVKISLVRTENPRPERRRRRRHRQVQRRLPDVVFHAPKSVPSFADGGRQDESSDSQSRSDDDGGGDDEVRRRDDLL